MHCNRFSLEQRVYEEELRTRGRERERILRGTAIRARLLVGTVLVLTLPLMLRTCLGWPGWN